MLLLRLPPYKVVATSRVPCRIKKNAAPITMWSALSGGISEKYHLTDRLVWRALGVCSRG